jgi:WD40 repeat protein/serine/threonine protein kinase
MTNWNPRANQLFLNALELGSIDEREKYLDEACNGHATLRAEVESLLEASAKAGSFLRSPAPKPELVPTVDKVPVCESAGTVIGPYKLLEQIGEGGFGVVFMAEQTHPVRRRVALKVLKPGMDTRQVVARFEAERQALALMDHPNIAKVHDAGATDFGRPYFVMELVKGLPITDFCDQNQLTPQQRLELFVTVCQAVQHAHQKGVIHRDLKPSNILVAVHDTTPVVKVIDFGVAKALGQELTDKTLFTGFAQMIGTPLYMSPEQVGQSSLDIDTRSDIYSLGVLLYELLAGSTPFKGDRFKQAAYDEIRRIIREEEPPKPSTRLSESKDSLQSISATRHTEPAKLTKLVCGELDWIVMKALEKDRNRRYETASAFAADVQRYLSDEPVQACPPSAMYRFRKLARRNKRVAATASFVFALLVLTIATFAVSYAQIQGALRQKTDALQQESDALEREKGTSYLQRIALAGRELGAGNFGRAEMLLDDCPEHLRGWEWRFLKRLRYGSAKPMQHQSTVSDVIFSPDGRQIATVCLDGPITIWDARTGQELQSLQGRTAPVGGVDRGFVRGTAYSPDGHYLAVARNDGGVRVWDLSRGHRLYDVEKAHDGRAWYVAISPDSRTLASCGEDRTVRLWDLASGKPLEVFAEHPGEVRGVAFRPDGRFVVAACDDGTVKVWDRDTGRAVFSFRGEEAADPVQISFSSDARRVGWCCFDGFIKVWDTTTGRQEINRQSNTFRCRNVDFSPDGSRIALAGFDGTIRLLDAANGEEMLTIFAHSSYVVSVAFSPDGRQLASASFDQTVRLWDASPRASDPPTCVTLSGHDKEVSGVAFSRDGRWLASASWDHTVKIWEIPLGASGRGEGQQGAPGGITLRHTLRGHSGIVWALAFSPDSRTLASISSDNTAKLWDLEPPTGDTLSEIRSIAFTRRVLSIAFSPDGGLLAIGEYDGIAVYDPATGKRVHRLKRTPAPVPSLAFHPSRPLLISSGASDPVIKVWAVAAEQFHFEIRQKANPSPNVAVSPDGRLIASPLSNAGPGDHAVMVWDVDWDAKTYRKFRRFNGHQAYVWRVAFSPDGRYLASGSWDSMIKIWDLEAPESTEPETLRGHAGFILGLAFSPDGRRLASASGYGGRGELRVWDASLWKDKSSAGH